jgi:hypothetical protein
MIDFKYTQHKESNLTDNLDILPEGKKRVVSRITLEYECYINTNLYTQKEYLLSAKQELWHKVYGDLMPPIQQLICYAISGADDKNFQKISDICEQLITLLKKP